MIRASKITLLLAAASLTATTACMQTQPADNTRKGAVAGALLGAAAGALTSDKKGRGAVTGALVGAAAGGALGYSLDAQEAKLRSQLGDRATITNTGDRLIVSMSQDILFATDSAALQPSIRSELRTVAASLNEYPGSTVQVLGHTDSDGDATYNYDLSQRRAAAVSAELIAAGVSSARVQSIGRGEDQPVATNLTAEGKAQNRRVEIVILPNAA